MGKYIVIIFSLFILACQNSKSGDNTLEVVDTDIDLTTDNNKAIRTPKNMTPTDTVNVAKMEFDTWTYDFGNIQEGKKVSYTYKFKNTGVVPLVIKDIKSSCGCAVPKWTKAPVAVGEKGSIEVIFDSKGKEGRQDKPFSIIANTWPLMTMVVLEGNVLAPMLEPEDDELSNQ